MSASKAFVLGVFFVTVTAESTPFRPCARGPVPIELRVMGCKTEPCLFYRGTNVVAEWDFSAVENTEDLRPVVIATVLGVTLPYPLPEQNACKSLINGECPLNAGEEVTYGLDMPILNIYPKVSLALEFRLVDSNNHVHVCFRLNAKVTDKPT